MKSKIIVVSTIILILILLGGTSMAWFVSNPEARSNTFTAGTVGVEVLEPGFKDLSGVEVDTYDKEVKVKSTGSKKTYVRVRLIPMWSNPSLPVSNVELNLADNGNWIDGGDGYYYFKYYLTKGQETSLLVQSVTFKELGPEYDNATFTLKVVAEAVQASNDAFKEVWDLGDLPFDPNKPWSF